MKILRELAEKFSEDNELEKSLKDNGSHFEELAMSLLTQCYASDPLTAEYLLIRKVCWKGMCKLKYGGN